MERGAKTGSGKGGHGGNSNRSAIFYTGEVTYRAKRNLPFSSWEEEEEVMGGRVGQPERVENKR